MRLLNAAVLTAAALVVGSIASAQGIGDAAAREKEKRKTATPAGKPAKVFTESDLGGASAVASAPPAPSATPGAPAAAGAEGKPADPKAKPKTEAELEAEAEKERQKAIDDWRTKLDEARKQEQQYRELVDRIQLDLNDTSSLYSPGRTRRMETLEEAKTKLTGAQARVAELEEQGRRSNYR
jgi:hypothetical protein